MNHKKAQEHFQKADKRIYRILKGVDFDDWFDRYKPNANKNEIFLSLCRSIIGQQLSGKVARVIYQRFLDALPGIPTPKLVLDIKDDKLRDVGLSWSKVSYIKDLAKNFSTNTIRTQDIKKMKDSEVITELTKVKGIGPWTAEMFLIFTLGRENVFS